MTFEQLEDLFFAHKINASPSGFHGFLCGRLSCGAVDLKQLVDTSTSWLGLSSEQAEAAENDFEEFYQSSLNNLEDISFLFLPVLPDDELPLTERLVAVGEWCTNYISGLGEGMGKEFDISMDGKEALEDISAIGQISVDFEIEDDGERDYAELVEFIRIAVQLIFSDLRPELDTEAEPTIH
ncbi:MAG: UPF0149 family protein [Porticoccaceae bacterium]|nr:UPF0149 family protein [bacterium]MDG0972246.1 UPF0149 family protein [Porticoccaceae bacterium]MDG1307973.1 UPF0149 family protein [Porticoccaceae bacterium]